MLVDIHERFGYGLYYFLYVFYFTYFIWCCILKMDKLVKLLNEYEREREWLPKDFEDYTIWDIEWNEIVQSSCDPDSRKYFKYYIISKDYQFIKWLVENDKINFKKFDGDNYDYLENPIWSNNYDTVWDYKTIIQWLSISDTPIDDLISYLR